MRVRKQKLNPINLLLIAVYIGALAILSHYIV
jgi:hypothetical protein